MNLRSLAKDRILWLVLGISFVLLLAVLIEPLSYDNAVYQSIALDFLQRGRIPYLGSFDQNFPGIIYFHVLAISIFGKSEMGFRVFDLILQLAFDAWFYRYLTGWMSRRTAALAALLYVGYYVSSGPTMYQQRDIYGAMVLVLSLGLLLRRDRSPSRWRILLAGLFGGIGILLRPTALAFLAGFTAFVFIQDRIPTIGRRFGNALIVVIAGLLPMALVLLYYASIPHGLQAFYNSTIRFNLDLYGGAGTTNSLWKELGRGAFLIVFALVALVKYRRGAKQDAGENRLASLQLLLYAYSTIMALVSVVIMGKYFRYQFAPFFVLLAPPAAICIEEVVRGISRKAWRYAAIAVAFILCTLVAYKPVGPAAFARAIVSGNDPLDAVALAEHDHPLTGLRPEREAIRYIDARKHPNESVEILSFDPRMRLHLDMPVVNGYPLPLAIVMRTDGTREGPPHYTDYQIAWQREYMSSLEQAKPQFVVIARNMQAWYITDLYTDFLHYLPGFDGFLAGYRYDTTFGGFQIYERHLDTPVR